MALHVTATMTQPPNLPRGLTLIGATISGALLALAIHMLTRGSGYDLAKLWQSDWINPPLSAAIAWWLMALAGFFGGATSASLINATAQGILPPRLLRLASAVGILALIAAGKAASAPNAPSVGAGVIGGFAALCAGAVLALIGASLALRARQD